MTSVVRRLLLLARWSMYLLPRKRPNAASPGDCPAEARFNMGGFYMRFHLRLVGAALALLGPACAASAAERWFEELKATATPAQLYTFLYALPKGGDLHNHLGGAARPEWLWDTALAQEKRGYVYYTKVKIQNCGDYGTNEFGVFPYLLLFKN